MRTDGSGAHLQEQINPQTPMLDNTRNANEYNSSKNKDTEIRATMTQPSNILSEVPGRLAGNTSWQASRPPTRFETTLARDIFALLKSIFTC